jgi:phosphoribosylamine--glycine ligase
MVDEGAPYRGFLYAGLMLTVDGLRVLEFNCRLGDPEAQVLLPRWSGDLLELLLAADRGDVTDADFDVDPAAAVGVVLASPGYPEQPRTDIPVRGIDAARGTGAQIYFAGVREQDGVLRTSGGRICTVVGQGADLAAARTVAYKAIERLEVPGSFYRRDIAMPPAARLLPTRPGTVGSPR